MEPNTIVFILSSSQISLATIVEIERYLRLGYTIKLKQANKILGLKADFIVMDDLGVGL